MFTLCASYGCYRSWYHWIVIQSPLGISWQLLSVDVHSYLNQWTLEKKIQPNRDSSNIITLFKLRFCLIPVSHFTVRVYLPPPVQYLHTGELQGTGKRLSLLDWWRWVKSIPRPPGRSWYVRCETRVYYSDKPLLMSVWMNLLTVLRDFGVLFFPLSSCPFRWDLNVKCWVCRLEKSLYRMSQYGKGYGKSAITILVRDYTREVQAPVCYDRMLSLDSNWPPGTWRHKPRTAPSHWNGVNEGLSLAESRALYIH